MEPIAVSIPPGVVTDMPAHSASGRWIAADKVSFRGGALENMRGWRTAFATPVSGIARAAVSWHLTNGAPITAVGTHTKLYLYSGGARYDITPARDSGTLGTDPFAVVEDSVVVTVTHTTHQLIVGDAVHFSGATAGGGITVDGDYVVISIIDPDTYTINAASPATSTDATTGGAAVDFVYDIHAGLASSIPGKGWGAGTWGSGTWGGPRTAAAFIPPRIWSLEPWGEDLLACPGSGDIYWWDASGGVQTRAVTLENAPTDNQGIVVSPEDRDIIVWGAGGDPLALQWQNAGTLTDWTPSATSTADTRRVLQGSRIVAGLKSGSETLIWTDNALYGLRTGGTTGHILRRIQGRHTILSQRSVVDYADSVFWWGDGAFYTYSGQIQEIYCPLTSTLKALVDMRQASKIVGGCNFLSGEVVWFWPSVDGDGENDRYVKFNPSEQAWDTGALARTAWSVRGRERLPIAIDPAGNVWEHEYGEVNQSVSVTIRARKYPASAPIDSGPITVLPTSTTQRIRARGRHLSMLLQGSFQTSAGTETWSAETAPFAIGEGGQVMLLSRIIPDVKFQPHAVRIGTFRFEIAPDGEQ